jgi:hypothetical protein
MKTPKEKREAYWQCCSFKPFVPSLSKHERRSDATFDKLRVNGDSLTEQY